MNAMTDHPTDHPTDRPTHHPTDQPPINPYTLLWERDQRQMKEQEALRPYIWLYSVLGIVMVVLIEIGLNEFWPLRLFLLPFVGYFVAMGISHSEDHVRGI